MFSTRKTIWLLMFLYLVVAECKGYEPAPSCASHECPSYTVVHSQTEFEIRSYKDAQWVSSPNISSNSYREAANKGFLVLLGYYKGNNPQHVKMNMTAPVLVDVQNSTYTVYFYLPKEYQSNIPPPLSNEIKAVKLPKHKYAAVRRFDGFMTDNNIPKEVALLKKFVAGTPYQRAAVDADLFTVAGYNSPFEMTNRVNEVLLWFD